MRFAAALFGQIYMPSLVGELGAKPRRGSVLVESRAETEERDLAGWIRKKPADAPRLGSLAAAEPSCHE